MLARLSLLALVLSSSACTLTNDLSGYSGGTPPRDSSVDDGTTLDTAVVDTAALDTAALDTAALDTAVADGAKDTSVVDTGTVDSGTSDTGATDTFVLDTFVADSGLPDTVVVDTFVTEADADPSCGSTFKNVFGLSEIMVRALSGSGDRREWLELTNYGSTSLDVSGITVKVVSNTGLERASFTFPSGTTLSAGEAVVVAGDMATFKGDVSTSYSLGKVFDFGKSGDILVNSASFDVRLLAPGCAAAYETAVVPSRSWPVGQAYAYPPPSATCSVAGRLGPGGSLSSTWKDVPKESAHQFGSIALDAGTQGLYGSPTKANTGIACP